MPVRASTPTACAWRSRCAASTRAFDLSASELATWTLEEGAFWGNYFSEGAIDWNACRGLDQASEPSGWLERDCAEPDGENPGFTLCGFDCAGECSDLAEPAACGSLSAKACFIRLLGARVAASHRTEK